jgi:hypothetical protein
MITFVGRPIRQCIFAGVAFLVLGAAVSQATNVQLYLNVNQAAGTWTVSAQTTDAQSLGIADFSLDVVGGGGITIQKAATASQTNQAPNPPFTVFKKTPVQPWQAASGRETTRLSLGCLR